MRCRPLVQEQEQQRWIDSAPPHLHPRWIELQIEFSRAAFPSFISAVSPSEAPLQAIYSALFLAKLITALRMGASARLHTLAHTHARPCPAPTHPINPSVGRRSSPERPRPSLAPRGLLRRSIRAVTLIIIVLPPLPPNPPPSSRSTYPITAHLLPCCISHLRSAALIRRRHRFMYWSKTAVSTRRSLTFH